MDAFERSAAWLSRGIASHLSADLDSHPRRSFRKLKAVCELAFLEFLGGTAPNQSLRAALAPVLSGLGTSRELIFLYACNLDHANLFLPLFVVLAQTGWLASEHAADCDLLARRSVRSSKERLPFRSADLLHAMSWWDEDSTWSARCVEALSVGCLRPGANAVRVSTADDYSVTHAVFYGTDFGRRCWPSSLADPSQVDEILQGIEVDALADRNWDILAEVALAHGYLGRREDQQRISRILVTKQEQDGSWESPASMDAILARDGFEIAERAFFERYHTTLLCLMAGSRHEIRSAPMARPCRQRTSCEPSTLSWDERIAALADRAATPAAYVLHGYRRLSCGEEILADEIPGSVFADPMWLQPALDLVLCARRCGADVAAWAGIARDLASDQRVASSRVMRTMRARITAAYIAGAEFEYDAELRRTLHDKLIAPAFRGDVFSQELVDALAYLIVGGTKSIPFAELDRLRAFLRDVSALAVRQRAWDALLTVMGLGSEVVTLDVSKHEAWTEILGDLWSETFGPGWCGMAGDDGHVRREQLWCQASQSAVMLARTDWTGAARHQEIRR